MRLLLMTHFSDPPISDHWASHARVTGRWGPPPRASGRRAQQWRRGGWPAPPASSTMNQHSLTECRNLHGSNAKRINQRLRLTANGRRSHAISLNNAHLLRWTREQDSASRAAQLRISSVVRLPSAKILSRSSSLARDIARIARLRRASVTALAALAASLSNRPSSAINPAISRSDAPAPVALIFSQHTRASGRRLDYPTQPLRRLAPRAGWRTRSAHHPQRSVRKRRGVAALNPQRRGCERRRGRELR
jgi:hypothetical protein